MAASSSDESKASSFVVPNPTVEGLLAQRYIDASMMTLEKFQSTIKFSLFKKHFPFIFEEKPEYLKIVYDQFCSQLFSVNKKDMSDKLEEKGILPLVSSLDRIINDSKNDCGSAIGWRPSGDPTEDIRDHTYRVKIKEKEKLVTYLNSLKTENEDLMNILAMNHAEIMQINKGNEELHRDFMELTEPLYREDVKKIEDNLLDEIQNET